MLVQFYIENFLSFDDEVLFNMIASDDKNHKNHLMDLGLDDDKLLRCAAIYGPNASGKSNLIKALAFARDIVINGAKRGQKIAINPFKLNKENSEKPSKFDFLIKIKDTLYSFGFSFNATTILEEWLLVTKKGEEEKPYYERIIEDGKVYVEIYPDFEEEGTDNYKTLELIEKTTGNNQLFLTKMYENYIDKIKDLVNWFASLKIMFPNTKYAATASEVLTNEKFKEFLEGFLKTAQTGIAGISFKKLGELDFDKHFLDMPEETKLTINNLDENAAISIISPDNKMFSIIKTEEEYKLFELITKHKQENGNMIDFGIEEESDGTRRLFDFIPALFDLKSNEKVYVIDEIDSSLHPLLSKMILEIFFNTCSDEHNSQFIFTTHDTNLLDLNLLRKDEIYFIQKDKKHSSRIYSLADFEMNEDLEEQVQNGYLEGRFGAIPFIADIKRLGWLSK